MEDSDQEEQIGMKFNKYAYKNDTAELIELCQFIRDVFPQFREGVKREPYIFFNDQGKYVGYRDNTLSNNTLKFKNPDIAVYDKNKNLIFCYEVDGSIHDEMFDNNNRNKVYKKAKIPLLITNKLLMETTIIDDAYKKITKFLDIK